MNPTPFDKTQSQRILDSFSKQGLMASFDAQLEEIEPGHCVISAPVTDKVSQQHGFAHAGLSFAIGDSAAGYAALTMMPPDREVMTAEIKINLIAPANGQKIIAEGRVIRAGHRLITVQSDIYALDGADRLHVAIMLGTMVSVSA